MSRFFVMYLGLLCLLGDCVLSAPSFTDRKACDDPKDVSNCQKATKIQYYYDKEKKKCESFIYQGCSSSRNRFNTKGECQRTCGTTNKLLMLTW